MATDLSVFEEAAVATMVETFVSSENDMLLLCTPKVELKTTVSDRDLDGAAKFNTQSGASAATARYVRAYATRSNPVVKEARIPLTNKQYRDVLAGGGYDIGVEIGGMLGRNALGEISDDWFSLAGSVRSVAHPENGVSGSGYAAVGGGTVYYADNFDMTGVNGDAYTQANDYTLPFNAANLDTLLVGRRGYKNRDGKPRMPQGKPYLLLPAGLERLGLALANQSGRFFNGADAELGFAGSLAGVIVPPAGTFASDAFSLYWPTPKRDPASGAETVDGPIRSHIRLVPSVRIAEATDGNYFNVIVEFEYDNYLASFEGNYFYSEP